MQLMRDSEATGITDGSVQTPNAGGTKAFIKLPTIVLPHFLGEYHNWLEFRDTFQSLIHKNTLLDNIQKFHYLRASLQGEATHIIKSLEMSSENYRVAWDLINERYNNTRQLTNNHVHALFNISVIQKESSAALRQLIDTVSKNLRALDTLDEKTQFWDTLIIYLVASKLDSVTLRHWEVYKNTLNAKPVLQNLKTYLKDRADLLQTLEEKHKQNHVDIKSNKPAQNQTSTSRSPSCPLCKAQHYLFSCPDFKQMTVEQRIEKVSKMNVCSNCLYPGHEKKTCRGGTCKYCSLKHNTMLHIEKPKSSSITCTSTQQTSVLLSTTLVDVLGSDGKFHTARCLLDNGSTSSYVTKNLCTRLNLTLESINGSVSGINGQKTNILYRTNIQIKSLHNSFTMNSSCLVLDEISNLIPNIRIQTEAITLPKHIKLADPRFHEPAPVDIITWR